METVEEEKPEIVLALSGLFLIKHFAVLHWSGILLSLEHSKYKTLNTGEFLSAHKHSSCNVL